MLLTTQYLAEADQLADRIAMLDRGRIIAEGTADQLKSSLGGEVVRLQFADSAGYLLARQSVRAIGADERLCTLEVATDGSAAAVHDLLGLLRNAGAPAARVSVERPSLDDVFLSLTAPKTAEETPRRQPRRQPRPPESERPMTAAYALSDTRVMIGRCLRRSLRDPEAFFTALMLPVVLMLLFVYVFGGAMKGHRAA